MWTATLESVEKDNGLVSVIVSFTSDVEGEEPFKRQFNINDLNGLKRSVQNVINKVASDFKLADELAKLIGKPIDTSIIIQPPTQEEIDRKKYINDLAVLNRMIEGIKNSVRKDTDPDYLAQLELVKKEFKPEYEQFP